ncbi:MAG: hypothetical protein M3R52_08505 [Acidobacteriota bacterium]|nr:hypothetical protein [Acidobacteriota bacterium]
MAASAGHFALAQVSSAAKLQDDKAAKIDALFREYDRPDVPGARTQYASGMA